VDWTYSGPIYRCSEATFDVPCRLLIDASKEGLTMRLSADVEKFEEDARGAIASRLRDNDMTVFLGRPDYKV
jgi:hypothetical protein